MTQSIGRIQVPASARRGEAVEVRLLIQHPMEPGFRRDTNGRVIPLNVVTAVSCRYGEREVFRGELGSGIAANPYLAFWLRADVTADVTAEWVDDAGDRGSVRATLVVT